MESELQQFVADHHYLLSLVGRQGGLVDPVPVNLSHLAAPLMGAATRREALPIDGVLVRDWGRFNRELQCGVDLGMRRYEIEGISFVVVHFQHRHALNAWALDFVAVGRADYLRLFRLALRLWRRSEEPSPPPILPAEQLDVLWKHSIGYLEPANLRRIKEFGGRAQRGLLLTGAPGNGKTMACRWIWEECKRRGWEYRFITPDSYRQARCNDGIEALFSVQRCGVLFFDDMDLALRDRETVHETEDQSVFLTALDGIRPHEGVVFIFTTNCALELIDRAFKRPGRIDVALEFRPPDAALRRRLVDRWHEEIRRHLNVDMLVASTDGYSFAELEELRNLLVMHFLDTEEWDWGWAIHQFDVNRGELSSQPRRQQVGFTAVFNGATNGE